MADKQLSTRITLAAKTLADWNNTNAVPLKGEMCLELATDANGVTLASKVKVGDGVHKYSELPYSTLTPSEVEAKIASSAYVLPKATADVLGGVKIGSNITINDGTISVASASADAKGVVQLSSAVNNTSNTMAGTAGAVKQAYDKGVEGVINAATAQTAAEAAQSTADQAKATAESKIGSVSIASGTNNGTIKLNVDGTATDNIAIKGLGSAAYTNVNAYATAEQGTKADNAMPISGGTFTGSITLNADPTTKLQAATKQYVDSVVTDKLSTSDAMVFRGTLGTNGTITAVPTINVVKGDTYKIITAGTYAGYTGCKIGDMLIALSTGTIAANTTNWAYVPSGDEAVTTIQYSTTTQNVTTTAQTGTITLAEGATKQVDTSITAASTSTKLPTSQAVASFVEGKGYKTTDQNVINTLNTTAKAYVTGTTSATTATGGQVFDTGVYLDTTAGHLTATQFNGSLNGNASSASSAAACTGNSATATQFSANKDVTLTGQVTGTASSKGGWSVVTTVAQCSTDAFVQGTDTLILNGNF